VFGEGIQGSPGVRRRGPGAEEDAAGRPFVGEAGKLLTKIIENAWASSGRMFIFVMWSNAAPTTGPEADEVQTCLLF